MIRHAVRAWTPRRWRGRPSPPRSTRARHGGVQRPEHPGRLPGHARSGGGGTGGAPVRAGELGRDNARTMLRFYINYSDALTMPAVTPRPWRRLWPGSRSPPVSGLERSTRRHARGQRRRAAARAGGVGPGASQLIERALELDPPAHHLAHLRLLLAWLRSGGAIWTRPTAILTEFRGLVSRGAARPAVLGAGRLDRRRAGPGHRRRRAGLAARARSPSSTRDRYSSAHGATRCCGWRRRPRRALDRRRRSGRRRAATRCERRWSGSATRPRRPPGSRSSRPSWPTTPMAGGPRWDATRRGGGPAPPPAVRRSAARPAPGRPARPGRGRGRCWPTARRARRTDRVSGCSPSG